MAPNKGPITGEFEENSDRNTEKPSAARTPSNSDVLKHLDGILCSWPLDCLIENKALRFKIRNSLSGADENSPWRIPQRLTEADSRQLTEQTETTT